MHIFRAPQSICHPILLALVPLHAGMMVGERERDGMQHTSLSSLSLFLLSGKGPRDVFKGSRETTTLGEEEKREREKEGRERKL